MRNKPSSQHFDFLHLAPREGRSRFDVHWMPSARARVRQTVTAGRFKDPDQGEAGSGGRGCGPVKVLWISVRRGGVNPTRSACARPAVISLQVTAGRKAGPLADRRSTRTAGSVSNTGKYRPRPLASLGQVMLSRPSSFMVRRKDAIINPGDNRMSLLCNGSCSGQAIFRNERIVDLNGCPPRCGDESNSDAPDPASGPVRRPSRRNRCQKDHRVQVGPRDRHLSPGVLAKMCLGKINDRWATRPPLTFGADRAPRNRLIMGRRWTGTGRSLFFLGPATGLLVFPGLPPQSGGVGRRL